MSSSITSSSSCNPVFLRNNQLRLLSLPEQIGVYHIDIDLTLDCNLRCIYCFKSEKVREHIQERVAYDAVVWFLYATSTQNRLSIALMGGEPLTNFSLIKKWIPFVKRRTQQHGKEVRISMTTNCTLVTNEVIEFWKKWELFFHTSIDGIPEVQNVNRPTVLGGPSAHLVENGVKKILKDFPETTARCTVVPETVAHVAEGYSYFRNLGYTDIAMIPADFDRWNAKSIEIYEEQFMLISKLWVEDIQKGQSWIALKNIDDYLGRQKFQQKLPSVPCGAGTAMLSIDIHGNIWPCSRMTKHKNDWCLGSIYGHFNDGLRKHFINGRPEERDSEECVNCVANGMCGGGCQAENLDCIGDIYGMHPNRCEMSRIWARAGKYAHDVLYDTKNPLLLKKYYPQEWRSLYEKSTVEDRGASDLQLEVG